MRTRATQFRIATAFNSFCFHDVKRHRHASQAGKKRTCKKSDAAWSCCWSSARRSATSPGCGMTDWVETIWNDEESFGDHSRPAWDKRKSQLWKAQRASYTKSRFLHIRDFHCLDTRNRTHLSSAIDDFFSLLGPGWSGLPDHLGSVDLPVRKAICKQESRHRREKMLFPSTHSKLTLLSFSRTELLIIAASQKHQQTWHRKQAVEWLFLDVVDQVGLDLRE